MISPSKLAHVLSILWSNPLFGDSFPPLSENEIERILHQINLIHDAHVTSFRSALYSHIDPLSPDDEEESDIEGIIQKLAIKGSAFCSAIPAGEINDFQRLSAIALSIDLLCWVDHCMDRGDVSILTAVRLDSSDPGSHPASTDPNVELALRILRKIRQCIRCFSPPEDIPVLEKLLFEETLQRQMSVLTLSNSYLRRTESEDAFWSRHAMGFTKHSILNVGLLYTTSALYSIYRHHYPRLPGLVSVFDEPTLVSFFEGPASAMIRVFDDIGDRTIDSGDDPRWGQFMLNIFNQPHALRQKALYAFIVSATTPAQSFPDFANSNPDQICKFFADHTRREYELIPEDVKTRNSTFLKLGKRLLEAGYVNHMGDKALADAST